MSAALAVVFKYELSHYLTNRPLILNLVEYELLVVLRSDFDFLLIHGEKVGIGQWRKNRRSG